MSVAAMTTKRVNIATQSLRCFVAAVLLIVTCFGGTLPRTTAESVPETPLESTEIALQCLGGPRLTNPREADRRSEVALHSHEGLTNPFSPAHKPASPLKGHRLPNGLAAPLLC